MTIFAALGIALLKIIPEFIVLLLRFFVFGMQGIEFDVVLGERCRIEVLIFEAC